MSAYVHPSAACTHTACMTGECRSEMSPTAYRGVWDNTATDATGTTWVIRVVPVASNYALSSEDEDPPPRPARVPYPARRDVRPPQAPRGGKLLRWLTRIRPAFG